MRCDLCGEAYETGKLFVAAQASACNDCITNLIDNESERRYERQQAKAMEDGFDAYTGEMRLRDGMAEARKYK